MHCAVSAAASLTTTGTGPDPPRKYTHFTLRPWLIPLKVLIPAQAAREAQSGSGGTRWHPAAFLASSHAEALASCCCLFLVMRARAVVIHALGYGAYLGFSFQLHAREVIHTLHIHGYCKSPVLSPLNVQRPPHREHSSLLTSLWTAPLEQCWKFALLTHSS